MSWIFSHQELREHPKLKRFAYLLGVNRREAIGMLHCLWWWALDYAPDGDLSEYTALEIAEACDWPGEDPNALIDALVNCRVRGSAGFLERDGRSLVIHDWEEYGGRLNDRREAEKQRKRDARRTSGGRPEDVVPPSGVEKIRVDKSREEESREEDISTVADAPVKVEKAPRKRDLEFEAIAEGECGTFEGLTSAKHGEFSRAAKECRKVGWGAGDIRTIYRRLKLQYPDTPPTCAMLMRHGNRMMLIEDSQIQHFGGNGHSPPQRAGYDPKAIPPINSREGKEYWGDRSTYRGPPAAVADQAISAQSASRPEPRPGV